MLASSTSRFAGMFLSEAVSRAFLFFVFALEELLPMYVSILAPQVFEASASQVTNIPLANLYLCIFSIEIGNYRKTEK